MNRKDKSALKTTASFAFFANLAFFGRNMRKNAKQIEQQAKEQQQAEEQENIPMVYEFILYEKALTLIDNTISTMMEVLVKNDIEAPELMNDGKIILGFINYMLEEAGKKDGN